MKKHTSVTVKRLADAKECETRPRGHKCNEPGIYFVANTDFNPPLTEVACERHLEITVWALTDEDCD